MPSFGASTTALSAFLLSHYRPYMQSLLRYKCKDLIPFEPICIAVIRSTGCLFLLLLLYAPTFKVLALRRGLAQKGSQSVDEE